MLITRTSPFSGKVNTLEVPCTQEQIDRWQAGAMIQDAMPNVPPALREFVKTGYTPDDWKKIFPEEEDEEVGD